MQILGFVNSLDVIGHALLDIENTSRTLERTASKIGLKLDVSKIKAMELIDNGDTYKEKDWHLKNWTNLNV